jgi:alkanesulfonate monooxygenase SsuD/methylene tetrahydromethanopterin reductase-like flavin-dependent oxidoreductase (luciferase family)
MTRLLHTAVALDGVGWHPAAWRDDADNARRLHDADYWLELALLTERGHIDLLTIDDTLALQSEGYGVIEPRTDRVRGRIDAVLLASRIAPLTTHIGFVPTVVTTHTEPFHVAKAIATLDFVSTGRAGVRLKVGASQQEARLVGRRTFPPFDLDSLDDPAVQATLREVFQEAADFTEVLHRLWDSWEDGAEIRDTATGRFVDREKLHYIDFSGEWFSVKGPLTVPRPPQGQPIVSVLGHGTDPYRLGALGSDLLYVTPRDAEHAVGIVDEIRWIEESVHRLRPRSRVLADVVVVLGDTEREAADRLARLDELAGEPLSSDALVFTGTATQLADLVESWEPTGINGVRFRPATNLHDLPRLVRDVVPELQRRGIQREGYAGRTLRENLGLARPSSRYAVQEAS